jgi:hypothetical protein
VRKGHVVFVLFVGVVLLAIDVLRAPKKGSDDDVYGALATPGHIDDNNEHDDEDGCDHGATGDDDDSDDERHGAAADD